MATSNSNQQLSKQGNKSLKEVQDEFVSTIMRLSGSQPFAHRLLITFDDVEVAVHKAA